jgi:DNA-binding response OmpR family regulator
MGDLCLSSAVQTALVVDEDSRVRETAAGVLKMLGHRVLRASDSSEALRLLERHRADIFILLTAVALPGMSGLELAARLKATSANLKVIYLSGLTDVVRVTGVMHPASNSLRKPVNPAELEAKVRALLAEP